MRITFAIIFFFAAVVFRSQTPTLTLFKINTGQPDTLKLDRLVLLETDTLSYIGEAVGLKDSFIVFKSKSNMPDERDSTFMFNRFTLAGVGYCKDNKSDKYMARFRRKGTLLTELPAYVSGGIGLSGILAAIADRHFVNFMGDKTNRMVSNIGAYAITASVTYTIFHYFYHRSKIKYYDLNRKYTFGRMKQ